MKYRICCFMIGLALGVCLGFVAGTLKPHEQLSSAELQYYSRNGLLLSTLKLNPGQILIFPNLDAVTMTTNNLGKINIITQGGEK